MTERALCELTTSYETHRRSSDMERSQVWVTRMRRRSEQREIRLYYMFGFAVCLPVVCCSRLVRLLSRNEQGWEGSTILEETSAKVRGMLGFVFMA